MIDLFYSIASPFLQRIADALGGFVASLDTERIKDLLRIFVAIISP